MEKDSLHSAVWPGKGIVLAVAQTTASMRQARQAQGLDPVAAVALGRLLTSLALLRFVQPRQGTMSLQIVCTGPLRQVFADVTATGDLRGYCRGQGRQPGLPAPAPAPGSGPHAAPTFAARADAASVPALAAAPRDGSPPVAGSDPHRLSLAPWLQTGTLSVIRAQSATAYSHSTVALTAAEVDADVCHFAHHSEQIVTLLHCAEHAAGQSAGLIVQGLPDADPQALAGLQAVASAAWLQAQMAAAPRAPAAWLHALVPTAQLLAPQALRWQCRCSLERALGATRMLPQAELAAMVAKGESSEVTCEFCHMQYAIGSDTLRTLLVPPVAAVLH